GWRESAAPRPTPTRTCPSGRWRSSTNRATSSPASTRPSTTARKNPPDPAGAPLAARIAAGRPLLQRTLLAVAFGGFEEGFLFRRGGTPQHLVAMRETTEARDDVAMLARMHQVVGNFRADLFRRLSHQLFEMRHALILQRQLLGMHQRHIEKHPADPRQGVIKTACHTFHHQRAGAMITGKRFRLAAMNIACELVEQNHQRQA